MLSMPRAGWFWVVRSVAEVGRHFKPPFQAVIASRHFKPPTELDSSILLRSSLEKLFGSIVPRPSIIEMTK